MLWLFLFGAFFGVLFSRIWVHYTYWSRKGVVAPFPMPFVGNVRPWSSSTSELYLEVYKKYQGRPFCGIYEFAKQRLVLRDPALVQRILVQDFQHFTDRSRIESETTVDPLDNGLFTMMGVKWRALRGRLSPAFTSGKLKGMFGQMVDCSEAAAARLDGAVEVRQLCYGLATDVIASCIFGLDLQRTDPAVAATFKHMSAKISRMTFWRSMGYILLANWPWAAAQLGISYSSKSTLRYFRRVIAETMAHRRSSDATRDDFIQLLIQLAERGHIEYTPATREPDDDYLELERERPQTETIELNDDLLMAQAYSFLTAGTETVSNTIAFTLHELSKKEELQDQVRGEIQAALERHSGLSYQAVAELKLLEMCIQETLRMYPVQKQLLRICTASYVLDSTLELEVGDCVVIPVKGFHSDPSYFEEPDVYKPERFREPPTPGTYLPFGDGPRICLGMRFGLVEMKVALACLLHKYKLSRLEGSSEDVELNKWSFFSAPTHGINIEFTSVHTISCQYCVENRLRVPKSQPL